MSALDPPERRAVRSFVRRSGRMTRSQRRALNQDWSRFGVAGEGLLDLDRLFGRPAQRILEVGFGMGDALVQMAAENPERDYLGVEVYEPGIGRVLARLASLGLENVRVIRGDAVDVLRSRIPDESLDALLIWFPDPWPKKRHHKRRLVQPGFVSVACAKLKRGGHVHLATDWGDYAEQMLTVLEQESRLANVSGKCRFTPRPPERPLTKFERRGEQLGHPVWDLVYVRR